MASSSLHLSSPRASSITTTGSYARRSALWQKTGKLSKECCIVALPQHNLKHRYKGIGGGYKCDKLKRKYFVNATSTHKEESNPQANHGSKSILKSIKDAMDVFCTFIRPYPLIAVVAGTLSMSILAVDKLSDLSPKIFIGYFQYLAPTLGIYMYVVGLNQLVDVEIDKINKPYLPLASGVISSRTLTIILASFVFMSFGLIWIVGSRPMFWAMLSSFMIGTAYSINLPFLRWKRFSVLTAVTQIALGILAYNLGPFLHMKMFVLERAVTYPKPLIFAMVMTFIFNAVLAIVKDIPDIEGDKAEGIQTLAVRLGPKPVFWICVSILQMGYGFAILVGATSPFLWSKIFAVVTHAIMALILWNHAKSVDLDSKSSTQSLYEIIYMLFSAEYILVPFVK